MSLPNIPDISPNIDLTREEVINLLLTSIAMEEIGLSHIINAEGEKLQAGLCKAETIEDLLDMNKSTEKMLQSTIKKEMLLQYKLENVIEMLNEDDKKKKDRCSDDDKKHDDKGPKDKKEDFPRKPW
ncbi:hypothetical protein [Texcoconibacillus texcoconensis]|uniref:Uncharacterized protein n=1 Tax=Texcoconibacillus texcoconensis TaxID=1095777 RepID=A0A840QQM4_9BACI|nr:hypothetical protein [Texcoconibacillus texcoconensis]MBB5173631.1 hypothetical protein [Texcoconibacillus texcoconensis]